MPGHGDNLILRIIAWGWGVGFLVLVEIHVHPGVIKSDEQDITQRLLVEVEGLSPLDAYAELVLERVVRALSAADGEFVR